MSSINLNKINNFTNFNSFSYNISKEVKLNHSTNAYLAVDRRGDLVISFQNRFTRFLGQFFHFIFTKLHIRHETTNPKFVWQTLKNKKIIKESTAFPKNKKEIRQLFAQIIQQHVKDAYLKANPAFHPRNDNTMKQYQKYAYYLDQNQIHDIKNLLTALPDLNGYFEKSIDTPLTLAIKKESFDTIQHLLNLKDQQGALIDPNKPAKDGKSPLLLATEKDLPRRYFIPLFQSGAVPKDPQELKKIIQTAGDNQALIRAIQNVSERKALNWPEPKTLIAT